MESEIEKVSAYSKQPDITRADIDAVVEPALDAVTYKLTDAIAGGRFGDAARVLDELLRMREPPHRLSYGISAKMRQLLAARVCLESGFNADTLKEICSIRHDFQARGLISAARGMGLEACRKAVTACSQAAFDMNNGFDARGCLTDLLARLAVIRSPV